MTIHTNPSKAHGCPCAACNQKVTLSDVASPNPSPEASKVLDRAIQRSIDEQNSMSSEAQSVTDTPKTYPTGGERDELHQARFSNLASIVEGGLAEWGWDLVTADEAIKNIVSEVMIYCDQYMLPRTEVAAQLEAAKAEARLEERNAATAFLNKLVDNDVDNELEATDVVACFEQSYIKNALTTPVYKPNEGKL